MINDIISKPKIHVKHSRIEINAYKLGQCAEIEYLFSRIDPITHQRIPYGYEYDEQEHILILPRGMNISMLERIFKTNSYIDYNCDPVVDTQPLKIKYLARDSRQVSIIKFLIGVDEYEYTSTQSQLAVNSTTGSGKTFVTVASMCITGSRMIIITSSINWLKQWTEKICEYTKLTENDIYSFTGRTSIERIFTLDPTKYQVFMASHATLHSYANNNPNGWKSIEELFKYIKCGIKVFDECHLYFTNMMMLDYHTNTRKTIYLTATPARSSKDEDIIYQEYFRTIPGIELFDYENDPHVNYIATLFHSHPSADEVRKYSVGQFQFDRNIYMKYLLNKSNFLKLVSILIDMCLMTIKGKILIYIGINDGIEYVYRYILQEFPFLDGFIGIYTSMVSDKELRRDMLKKKIILSTTKSCGAASDITDLGACIVLNEPFRSKVIARQTLGRCRADNTLYIDCIDMSCFRTRLYYQAKKPVFAQYAKSCSEVLMDDKTIDTQYKQVKDRWKNKEPLVMPYFRN